MDKNLFNLDKKVKFGSTSVLVDPKMDGQKDYAGLIAKGKQTIVRKIKNMLWPLVSFRNFWFVDGFIETEAGKLLKKYVKKDSVFLDIGCGDLRLKKYLPKKLSYNGFDISLSETYLERALKKGERVNLALASAHKIPVKDNSITLAAATEVFEHIPDIQKAVKEINRIMKPGGHLIITIPNNYCHKYTVKGPHADHVNNWKFKEFQKFMENNGFRCLESNMKGYWIPLPTWLTKTSYQIPFRNKKEFFNTNFFYVFEKKDKS